MIDETKEEITDITDFARFDYFWNGYDYTDRLLINSDKEFLGKIAPGMTIGEYLTYKPMIFPRARFVFPDKPKDYFNGHTITIDIQLIGGKTLSSSIAIPKGWTAAIYSKKPNLYRH